jgi:penicillin-binding protein 1C
VWIGRPDGTPNPGYFGANIAAPLLLSIFNVLPTDTTINVRYQPETVSQKTICWPQGTAAPAEDKTLNKSLCPIRRAAWVLNTIVPPTFVGRRDDKPTVLNYHVDRETKQRVMPDCSEQPYDSFEVARWPDSLVPWLAPTLLKQNVPPQWTERCAALYHTAGAIRITGASDGEWIQRTPSQTVPAVRLRVQGAQSRINWIVNGRLVAETEPLSSYVVQLEEAGRYDITALDEKGRFDRITLTVRGGA